MSSHAFRQSLDDSIVKIDPSKALTSTHSLIERTIYPNWPMYAHVLSQCKSVCGKSWGSNAMAYKCKTCEKDPTCIICVDCFKKSNHEGHDYKLIRTGGGMCDCGDTDAWDPKGFCTDHQGIAEDSDCVSQLPEAPRRMLQELVGFSIKTVVRCLRIVASQAAASPLMDSIGFLLEGLIRVSQTGDAGRRLVAEVVCEGKDASLQDIFDLESGDHPMPPWNGALAPLHQLIYALIPDPWFKYRFARLLILQYVPLHLKQEANAVGRKHSQEKFLVSTAVQVLSVPSIIDRLLNADNLGFRKGAHIFHLMSTGLLSALAHMTVRCQENYLLADKATPLGRLNCESQGKLAELYRILYETGYVLLTTDLARSSYVTNSAFMRTLLLFYATLQNSAFVFRRDVDFSPFQEVLQLELTSLKLARRTLTGILAFNNTPAAS
eukprot:PhF_6_TR31836/c0_g2_i1/m.47114